MTLQATPEVDCKWVSYSSIFQAVHLRNAKRTFVESLTIKFHSFQDQPECISPANTLSQRYAWCECSLFDRQLWSAVLIILANGRLNTLMNQVRMDDRYLIRWLSTVNRISCGGGFWPWFRGTPLKKRLVSAVSGADSAGVSPQPGPFWWSLFFSYDPLFPLIWIYFRSFELCKTCINLLENHIHWHLFMRNDSQ